MNDLEMPGLTDTLQRKLDWLRETNGVKSAQVKLDEYELTYVLSCIRYYMSDMAMRRAEKLPLSQLPVSGGYSAFQKIYAPDTLPSETE